MRYRIRGPSSGLPEESEEIFQFACYYPPKSGTPVNPASPRLTPPSPELSPVLSAMSDLGDEFEEIISSGRTSQVEKDKYPRIPRTGFVRSASSHPRVNQPNYAAYIGVPGSVDPPSGGSMGDARSSEIQETMLRRLEGASLFDMMQFYARAYYGPAGDPSNVQPPITEGVMVYTLSCLGNHVNRARDAEREARERAAGVEAEFADLQVLLNRSELLVKVLLDRLERENRATAVAPTNRPRHEGAPKGASIPQGMSRESREERDRRAYTRDRIVTGRD